MSLEERIKGISVACNPSGESMRHKASALAAEADELMREMADLIDRCADIFESEMELGYEVDCRVMNTKYYAWKEKSND